MYIVHNENRKGDDDDERQFVHLSHRETREREREKKKEKHRSFSICPIASGSSLKCRHEYTRRGYLNKRSNQPLFNYLFLSNELYNEHSSMNNFASSIRHRHVMEGSNDVIIA
jgi:hypothetical protein